MSARFAEGTHVQPETSQGEIAGLLRRYGADGFAYGWERDRAVVQFTAHGRRVRFVLVLPSDPASFATTPTGKMRPPAQRRPAMDAEVRRLWRCLLLAIKAKLEVVESGIASFEEEFASHIVLPDGTVVADHLLPAIAEAYSTGNVPTMLQLTSQ